MRKIIVFILGITALMAFNAGRAPASSKEEIFLSGKEWRETMNFREKFMALLPPRLLLEDYDIRLLHSLPEYIQVIDKILKFNPELQEEDVTNIFASAVYRFEPQARVQLKSMEFQFLQGDLEIKPLHGPRLTYNESRELGPAEFSD